MRTVAEESEGERSWGDQQRALAALMAEAADQQDGAARRFRAMAPWCERLASEAGLLSPREIAATWEAAGYRLRTMQRVFAEQARNYDAMIAAGGPANAPAFAAWRESCELASALLPTDFGSPDLDR